MRASIRRRRKSMQPGKSLIVCKISPLDGKRHGVEYGPHMPRFGAYLALGLMSYYEIISHGYRFGRVLPEHVEARMPEDLGKIVTFLQNEHGMLLEGIYLENYKSPDSVVVVKGKLPMHQLVSKFSGMPGLRFGEQSIVSDTTFSILEGSTP